MKKHLKRSQWSCIFPSPSSHRGGYSQDVTTTQLHILPEARISKDCRALIMLMLKSDPAKRVSLDGVVNSVWIGNADSFPKIEQDPSAIQVLRHSRFCLDSLCLYSLWRAFSIRFEKLRRKRAGFSCRASQNKNVHRRIDLYGFGYKAERPIYC